MGGNSDVVGLLEFLDRIEKVEDTTGSADLDELGAFEISSPPT
jgi:hypothetical protein